MMAYPYDFKWPSHSHIRVLFDEQCQRQGFPPYIIVFKSWDRTFLKKYSTYFNKWTAGLKEQSSQLLKRLSPKVILFQFTVTPTSEACSVHDPPATAELRM